MRDRDEKVTQLRDEFWDLQFEAPRPRAPAIVERDQTRMREIKDALTELGADVGPRPGDVPPEVA